LDVKTMLDGCWSKQLDIRMGLFSNTRKSILWRLNI
jgi:hypothetical protein